MVSKNQIKLITSLQQKKFRKEHKLFLAEGRKVIQELIQSGFEIKFLFVTGDFFPEIKIEKKYLVSEHELKKISALTTPNDCLAVFEMPSPKKINARGLLLALDTIRDPGNLGTIIRLCDWFGITELICSEETADCYNPKVIQATMGSIARVNVNYVNLKNFLNETNLPIFGTFMDGDTIYKSRLPQNGIIIMGNEANGISPEIEKMIKNRLTIPRFGDLKQTESLNVATATAIVLSEFKRNN